jgi:hypothetical protein
MAENEDAFAIEAQEEAILSRSQELLADTRNGRPPKSPSATSPDVASEESPLLPRTPFIQANASRDASPNRASAITKPWIAYDGLPWYRKPSVTALVYVHGPLLNYIADLLAPTCILPFLPCMGWTSRSKDVLDPQLDMSRLSLRQSRYRP